MHVTHFTVVDGSPASAADPWAPENDMPEVRGLGLTDAQRLVFPFVERVLVQCGEYQEGDWATVRIFLDDGTHETYVLEYDDQSRYL